MPHPIAPITIDGGEYCCQDALGGRTVALVTGDASEIAADEWEIFLAHASGDSGSNPQAEAPSQLGGVAFGVCCAAQVVLDMEGSLETLNDGYDWVEVSLNGVVVQRYESSSTSADPWDTVGRTEQVTLILDVDRPCGNVIEIAGGTGDDVANNGVFWRVSIASIT